MNHKKRIKVIACEIAFRELCLCASQTPNIVDFAFLEKGLHDMGQEKMSKRIQAEIDITSTDKYESIILAYGLCNNGIAGLHAPIPMIIPRAHDCITFFLGSKEKYSEFFAQNPGTYFHSAGWDEREIVAEDTEGTVMSQLGINKTYDEFLEEFGEDNADFLMDFFGGYKETYSKLAFINTHVGDIERYRDSLAKKAKDKGWEAVEVEGDNSLLLRLLSGDWDEKDFLVVPPNHITMATNDQRIIDYI